MPGRPIQRFAPSACSGCTSGYASADRYVALVVPADRKRLEQPRQWARQPRSIGRGGNRHEERDRGPAVVRSVPEGMDHPPVRAARWGAGVGSGRE